MTLAEDNTICQYCGRHARMGLEMTDDHVPPLNCKFEDGLHRVVKKTLIRACSECNGIASDKPHADYLERHFWLKAAYLRRYKRILLNYNGDKDNVEDGDLKAYLNNIDYNYEEVLRMIGFGIKTVDQIESPILNLKNKKKQRISDVLIGYLYGWPHEDDEDDEKNDPEQSVSTKENQTEDIESIVCTFDEFIEFLIDENMAGLRITSQDSYRIWVDAHHSRFEMLDLPSNPEESYPTTWKKIRLEVSRSMDNSDTVAFQSQLSEHLLFNSVERDEENRPYIARCNFITFLRANPLINSFKSYKLWLQSIDDELIHSLLPKQMCWTDLPQLELNHETQKNSQDTFKYIERRIVKTAITTEKKASFAIKFLNELVKISQIKSSQIKDYDLLKFALLHPEIDNTDELNQFLLKHYNKINSSRPLKIKLSCALECKLSKKSHIFSNFFATDIMNIDLLLDKVNINVFEDLILI
ncbi:hypothetical protein [Catenovulum adriaticum]|uniref:HNH endonuclease n=1 Tax=Catenovulum adriaticum TaxID=2984846 RepID=A0ABY7AVD2_9ALTE|nr:hypothetical protein [Catenovulum sp. TS8]WAJ72206.1 hypothetical protein OLW01_18185 [Catenovulum sp. TS8]